MIYTITMNPSIDYYMTVSNPLIQTEVNRASGEILKAGGKGLNVSFLLDEMKIPSIAIALLGGFTGDFIKKSIMERDYITLKNISINGLSRINVKIHHREQAFCVNGKGSEVSKNTKNKILEALDNISENDYVLVCGSRLKGLDDEFLIDLANFVHNHKAKLIMDMDSLTIDLLKKCKPYLIKPNFHEFKMLINNPTLKLHEVDGKIKELLSTGLESILVSLGANGAILTTKNRHYKLTHPNIKAVNKVGLGDAMLASYIGMLSKGASEYEALKWGGAAGNAVASTMDNATLHLIEKYYKKMMIEEILSN